MAAITDVAGWQAVLDREAAAFAPMQDGAAIGLVAREHLPGGLGSAMVWRAEGGLGRAHLLPFQGFAKAGVDLLFAADAEALALLASESDPLRALKGLVRKGNLNLYIMTSKNDLQERGFEEFLDTLGLAFLGACR